MFKRTWRSLKIAWYNRQIRNEEFKYNLGDISHTTLLRNKVKYYNKIKDIKKKDK